MKQIYRFPINRNVEFESNGGENNIIKTDKSWDYYLNYYSRFADDCVSVDKAKKQITIEATIDRRTATFVRLTWINSGTFSLEYDVSFPAEGDLTEI